MKTKIIVLGMTCSSCSKKITKVLKKFKNVKKVEVNIREKTALITHNGKLDFDGIKNSIEDAGYKYGGKYNEKKVPIKEIIPYFIAIAFFYFGSQLIFGVNVLNFIPTVDDSLSLLMIFFVGLLTSVHCIGMCGSINLATVLKGETTNFKRPLFYNLGRVVSYTAIGGLAGLLGSAFSFSDTLQSTIIIIAGTFMLIMGLSMIGWLPKKLYFLIPKMPIKFKSTLAKDKGPFYVGLLNGFMPCGPLQAMQLYALSTGSIALGALSMFLFSIGTFPLMFGFGLIFIKLRGKYHYTISKISAVLILLLAIFMINRGFNLSGIDLGRNIRLQQYSDYAVANIVDDVQYVEIKLEPSSYQPIIVQKGVNVEFNIKAEHARLFGCTNEIIIPSLDIRKPIRDGDNIIKFTPDKVGNINFTCWMGMVNSHIKVVEDITEYGGTHE